MNDNNPALTHHLFDPQCIGVRFFVGKFVELAYVDAALAKAEVDSGEQWNPNETDAMAMDALRQSLGHPLSLANTVQCIVTGVHGMDAATASDRLLVASRLWAEGVSAEYMPQSGVMLSLLKRYRESLERMGDRTTVSEKYPRKRLIRDKLPFLTSLFHCFAGLVARRAFWSMRHFKDTLCRYCTTTLASR